MKHLLHRTALSKSKTFLMMPRRKILQWVLLLLLAGGLGHYIIQNLDQFKVIQRIQPKVVSLILILQSLNWLIASYRYYIIIQSLGLQISYQTWARIFMYAYFLNRFYPQSGSLYRAAILKKDYGFPISNYVSAFAAFSFLDRLFALSFTLTLVLLFEPRLAIFGINLAAGLSGTLLLCIIFIRLLPRATVSDTADDRLYLKLIKKLNARLSDLGSCLRSPQILITFALTGLLTFSISLTVNYLCFREVGDPITLARISILNFTKTALNTVPLTPGNIGATEAAYGLLSASMKNSPANAIIVATVTNLCAVASVSLTCGLVFLVTKRRSKPDNS